MNAEHDEAPLVPILIDGAGRDGTTLAMQLLGTAPGIAFDRIYPFEQRYFSYLLQWARLPLQESWEEASWNLDSLAHSGALGRLESSGSLPWHERSLLRGTTGVELWREAFEAVWAIFSRRAREAMRARLGDPELEVGYYAQKIGESWKLPIDRLPPMRLICLLRDPRDTWLSSLAFHRRRAASGDSFLPGDTEQEALEIFIRDQRERLRWLAGVETEYGAPLVRFETLVGDLGTEAARLGAWLGVSLDAEAVLQRRAEFADHMTAGGAEQSIARWRREMEPDLAARFRHEMGAELEQLGYEP